MKGAFRSMRSVFSRCILGRVSWKGDSGIGLERWVQEGWCLFLEKASVNNQRITFRRIIENQVVSRLRKVLGGWCRRGCRGTVLRRITKRSSSLWTRDRCGGLSLRFGRLEKKGFLSLGLIDWFLLLGFMGGDFYDNFLTG